MNTFKHNAFMVGLLLTGVAHATTPSINQTQSKISTLNQEIQHLKKSLNDQHAQKKNIIAALKSTDEKIGEIIKSLYIAEKNINIKTQEINALQKKITTLEKTLATQKDELEQHVISRYKMGEYQPAKWFLNQENPAAYDRLLVFYQAVIKTRIMLIEDIKNNQAELQKSEQILARTLIENKSLKQRLAQKKVVLMQEKNREKAIVDSINKNLNHHTQTLLRAQKNREILEALLQNLTRTPEPKPTLALKRPPAKLQGPIGLNAPPIRRNQGMFYAAKEGTPVHAIYSGKVVFSEWLNGYGLIIIVDHGDGFMSLYANNQSLYKRKGERISKGEQIASVGHSGGKRENGLYFELRHKGKPVSAKQWIRG